MQSVHIKALLAVVAGCAQVGLAATLDLEVKSAGETAVQVQPGAVINYEIIGALDTDADNEGLAYILFDLSYSGGSLTQVTAPVGMSAFTLPDGITNPAPDGYGGAVQPDGSLVQVGGAQNTIKNTATYADYPIGSVVTGVAWPQSPATVASGSLTAPTTPGVYTLEVSDLLAAVIEEGEDGSGDFWATEAAIVGDVNGLTVEVLSGTIPTSGWWSPAALGVVLLLCGAAVMMRRRRTTA